MKRMQNQDHQMAKRAEQVVSWISHAAMPLTVIEIQFAVAIELDDLDTDEELLVSVCTGLATIYQESKVIRLIQEYLEHIRASCFPTAQAHIAKTCLTYLSFNVFVWGDLVPPMR